MTEYPPSTSNFFRTSLALSYEPTVFSAVLFAGRLEEGFRIARVNEFDAVEIGMRDPDLVDISWLKDKLEENQLQLSAIATGQSFLHDGLSLFSNDPDIAKKTVKRLQRFVGFAEELGAHVIIGGIRGRLTVNIEEQRQQQRIGIQSLRACATFAQDRNVVLLLEAINRYETNLVNSASEGLTLLEELGAGNVKLLLDTFHMNIEESSICDSIRRTGEHLGYIHFADSNRNAPGQGHIPFAEILQVLYEIQYGGYISAEILPLPDDVTAAKLAGDYLRNLLMTDEVFPG